MLLLYSNNLFFNTISHVYKTYNLNFFFFAHNFIFNWNVFIFSFTTNPMNDDYFMTIYIKSHARAGPYIVGAIFGYLLYKRRKSTTKLNLVIKYNSLNCITLSINILLNYYAFKNKNLNVILIRIKTF